jgi:hypothetical protein
MTKHFGDLVGFVFLLWSVVYLIGFFLGIFQDGPIR